MKENDMIAAIATAYGNGAIGIVRVSGQGAPALLKRIFREKKGAEAGKLSASAPFETHRMYYGDIYANGEVIDEVMVCPMLAPRSYTKEDTVEIYAHGGMVVLRSVLDAVLQEGARLAEPGEFTKRAFLNGRINLTQAEAVMDLINAGSDAARRAGLRQLGGGLSSRIEGLRDKILHWLAHIELSIDYPEHEDEAKNMRQILDEGGEVIAALEALYQTAAIGRMLKDGVKTAIIGRPNAGKSTLLNAILSEDRAIVHEAAGTTRDILTEHVVVGDMPLLLMDTAGLRDTADPVEKIGVEKTRQAAEEAELILYVVDRTQGFASEDEKTLQSLKNKPVIVLLNKSDLPTAHPTPTTAFPTIAISTRTGQGLDKLYQQISHQFLSASGSASATPGDGHNHTDIITRERHRILIQQATTHVRRAMEEITIGVPEDLVSVNLRAAYLALGEVLGVAVADDILDRIFAEFCLGK